MKMNWKKLLLLIILADIVFSGAYFLFVFWKFIILENKSTEMYYWMLVIGGLLVGSVILHFREMALRNNIRIHENSDYGEFCDSALIGTSKYFFVSIATSSCFAILCSEWFVGDKSRLLFFVFFLIFSVGVYILTAVIVSIIFEKSIISWINTSDEKIIDHKLF